VGKLFGGFKPPKVGFGPVDDIVGGATGVATGAVQAGGSLVSPITDPVGQIVSPVVNPVLGAAGGVPIVGGLIQGVTGTGGGKGGTPIAQSAVTGSGFTIAGLPVGKVFSAPKPGGGMEQYIIVRAATVRSGSSGSRKDRAQDRRLRRLERRL
jgi:hypothetical protein